MNNSCNIVQDLLAAYQDSTCSEESRQLVQNHLQTCADCTALLVQLQAEDLAVAAQMQTDVLDRQHKRVWKRVLAVSVSLALVFSAVFALLLYAVNRDNGVAQHAEFIFGESTVYTQRELKKAAKKVVSEFESGYEAWILLNIRYDEAEAKALAEYEEDQDVLIFTSDIYIGGGTTGGPDPHQVITGWSWILKKNSLTGGWEVLNKGFA